MELYPMGDSAIVIQLGTDITLDAHHRVRALAAYLNDHPFPGMIEYVPAFTTVTIFYNPVQLSYEDAESIVSNMAHDVEGKPNLPAKTVDVPVSYGGELGPDIEVVARHNGLTVEEVVSIHTSGEYLVYMIGFAPGFAYLGGMSEKIATPRRPSPRIAIPAGTVAIAGAQSGVYPIATPGGWQMIGRTPLPLFRPENNPPSLLSVGDIVRFYAVSDEEFAHLTQRSQME